MSLENYDGQGNNDQQTELIIGNAELVQKNEEFELKGIMTAKELYELKIKEVPKLVDPILIKTGLMGLAGSSDCGKSCILRQLAFSIVMKEKQFLGMKINEEAQKVIYVATEDDQTALSALLNKKYGENFESTNLANLRFVFDTENLIAKLHELMHQDRADLIIIDVLGDVFGGDINKMNEVRTYLHKFKQIADKYQCAVMFLHHTSKKSEDLAPNKANFVGSQGFEAKTRVAFVLKRDRDNPKLRHLSIVKGNYLSDDFKEKSIELAFDENELTFSPTGIKLNLSNIIKFDAKIEYRNSLIKDFHLQGFSCREISEKLKEKGIVISKSNVAQILKLD